jgi:S-formylglutathione hydrolase FrmB
MTPLLYAGRADTLEMYSVSMRKPVRCLIILPSDYKTDGPRYPVLYLLHGWSGHYASWLTEAPQLLQHADRCQMLIVCPDGGYDSWYIDSPVDSSVRYDTHVSQELVTYIDYYFHTIADRSGRAITGMSMGGHGALYLAIRHPDVYGAAGSMCGGLDLRPFKKNEWDLQGVLGNPLTHRDNWEKFSVIRLVPRLQGLDLPLMTDCGTGDFFLSVNRDFHRTLEQLGIPHTYHERPGEHNRAYWSKAIEDQILFFKSWLASGK